MFYQSSGPENPSQAPGDSSAGQEGDPSKPGSGDLDAGRRLTMPVGRFLIDLPGGARAWFGRQGFNEAGSFIQSLPVRAAGTAKAMVVAQVEALEVPHEEGGTRLERVLEGHRPHSWFIYFWKDTAFKDEMLELNGYFWREGLLFIFRNSCRAEPAAMSRRAERLEAMFSQVRRRSPLEIPQGPGFCLQEAYFPGRAVRCSDEHIELLVKFPARPGLSMRFCTDTVGELITHYPPLLEREAKGWFPRRLRGGERLRAGERPVGPFSGQELVQRVQAPDGGTGWNFTWECLGRPRDPLWPLLLLEMQARCGDPGPGLLAEREAVRIWEGVLASLRRRENFARSLRLSDHFRSSWSM